MGKKSLQEGKVAASSKTVAESSCYTVHYEKETPIKAATFTPNKLLNDLWDSLDL